MANLRNISQALGGSGNLQAGLLVGFLEPGLVAEVVYDFRSCCWGQGLEEQEAEGVVWVLRGCWLVGWGLSGYQVVGGGAEDSCDKGDVLHRRGVLAVLP